MLVATLTWVDVVDTAVKIGLSAAIGAIGAYFLAKRTQQHDFKREYFRRRQDVIERVSAEFAAIHMFFFNVTVDYSSLRDALVPGSRILDSTRDHYYQVIRDIGDKLRQMHVLEGQLLVADIPEGTDALRRYRACATDVNDILQLEHPTHSREQIAEVLQRLAALRDEFFSALAAAFRGM